MILARDGHRRNLGKVWKQWPPCPHCCIPCHRHWPQGPPQGHRQQPGHSPHPCHLPLQLIQDTVQVLYSLVGRGACSSFTLPALSRLGAGRHRHGSSLSSWGPVCAGGTHAFLGFQFVLHSHKIFLGLWALVAYIVFPPTPDKETTLQRFFISSHDYARSTLSPDPLSHIPLSGSTYQIPANRETIHVDYDKDTSLESFATYNLCDQRPEPCPNT